MKENKLAEIFMAVCAVPAPDLEPGVLCSTMTTGRHGGAKDPDD